MTGIKAGDMYIKIKADVGDFDERMKQLRAKGRAMSGDLQKAFNSSLGKDVAKTTTKLATDMEKIRASFSEPIKLNLPKEKLEEMSGLVGLSSERFKGLTERIATFNSQKGAIQSFQQIAKSADLSAKELKELQKELNISDESLKKFGATAVKTPEYMKALKIGLGAVTATVTAFAVAYMRMSKDILQMGDVAKKLNIPVEQLSRMKYAAERSSVSFEQLKGSLEGFSISISEAMNGSSEKIETFERLGLSLGELSNIPADKAMIKIADAIKMLPVSDQINLSKKIFGGSGKEFLMLLQEGGAGIEALYSRADKLGVTVKQVDVDKIKQAADNFDDAQKAAKALATEFTVAVAPVFAEIAGALTNLLVTYNEWERKITKPTKIDLGEKDIKDYEKKIIELKEQLITAKDELWMFELNKDSGSDPADEARMKNTIKETEDAIARYNRLIAQTKEIIIADVAEAAAKEELTNATNANTNSILQNIGVLDRYPTAFKKIANENAEILKNKFTDKIKAENSALERQIKVMELGGDAAAEYAVKLLELKNEAGSSESLNELIQQFEQLNAALNKLKKEYNNDMFGGLRKGFDDYIADANNNLMQFGDLARNMFKGLEDQLVSFATKGKINFKDFANSVITDMTRIMAQKAIAGATEGLFDMLFGGGSKVSNGTINKTTGILGKILVNKKHSGGVVGDAANSHGFVLPEIFVNAKKFHTGGMVGSNLGLSPDEIPIIAQQGEMILTKAQQKALAAGLNQKVNVTVINNTSAKVDVQEEQTADGVNTRIIINEMVAGAISTPGSKTQKALMMSNRLISR